jgi:protein-S-isoprenylcysteine O-methyltransferase Ste14
MGAWFRYWRTRSSSRRRSSATDQPVYVLVTAYLFVASAHTGRRAPRGRHLIAVIVLEAWATKVARCLARSARRRAGSSCSHTLVTDGVASFSRNPAYSVTIVQNVYCGRRCC